jgi:hypothetical protein
MVSSIDRISQQAVRAQEIKAAAPKNEVVKTDSQKTQTAYPTLKPPARESQETKVEEVKEKPAAESSEALRTLASKEPNNSQAPAGKNMVSADALIAAYKK